MYDLMSNAFEEVDYVIKTLKTSELTEEKTLVLLSSVMSWVNTPPKFEEPVAEGEEGEEEAEPEEEEEEEEEPEEEEKKDGDAPEEEEELDEDGNPIVIKKPIFFKESDFHLRVPHAKFQHLKTLETVAMSSTVTQPLLRVHVLCSGLRYGNGERIFYDHFQKAWIQNPAALPVIGKGDNLVPTIHVIDLARLVRRVVVEHPKVHPYIFAIDKTRNPTQKRIVQTIAKGMGTSQIANYAPNEWDDGNWGWKDFLTINLKMKASDSFKTPPLTPEQEEEEDADEQREAMKFKWHCQQGIIKNISSLNKEFNEFRGLNPVKFFITGPPASGKSYYAEKLAKYYNIPVIRVKELAEAAIDIANMEDDDIGEDEFKANTKAKIEEIRDNMVAEIEEARPETDEDPEEVDRLALKVRVPDDILYELLKMKLKENA